MGLEDRDRVFVLSKEHFRNNLFLRQLKCNASNEILRGRQIMKLVMEKCKADDHAQTLL